VTTANIEGLGAPCGVFVLPDGTRLFSTREHTILQLAASGQLSTIAGVEKSSGMLHGKGPLARFNTPSGLTLDRAGRVVVVDKSNHTIRAVTKGCIVSILAGNAQRGFADGQGVHARFHDPEDIVMVPNGDLLVSDSSNHSIRVVSPEGAVRTLAGNGMAGFANGQGADARFNCPCGLALDLCGNLLVADSGNHAIRLVTMAGKVSTVAGSGVKGFADGLAVVAILTNYLDTVTPQALTLAGVTALGMVAKFNNPRDIVVDGQGTIVVSDCDNHRLRKIVDGRVTTLAGSSEAGSLDGAGAAARFARPLKLALDERGRLLVTEMCCQQDQVRVVEASLVPPLCMGSLDEAVEEALAALEDFGKMMENADLADVVLVVEGQRFPAHRAVLVARSEYFRGLLRSGMQEGRTECDSKEIKLEQVSAGAFRVVLRYLYTAELPEWNKRNFSVSTICVCV
jgi:DNA-binding beta-propeller fold protein YncE